MNLDKPKISVADQLLPEMHPGTLHQEGLVVLVGTVFCCSLGGFPITVPDSIFVFLH